MKNYFPHDHHARSDKKIINLMRVFGLAGVGLYWCIIEMLYEENGWLHVSDLESIAYDLRADTKTINSLIANFDLFFIEGEMFSSKAVLSRLKLIEAKSSAASKAARQRWQKCKEDANAMQTHSDRNALKEIKENEIKLNESKEENNASLSPPLFKEGNSEALKAEPKKPKEKSSAKKEKVEEHYFEQSPYYDLQKFLEYWTSDKYPISEYPNTDTSYYYNAVKDWAEYGSRKNPGKQTAKDWIGTARTFMRGDLKEGKLKLKNSNNYNGSATNQNEQPNTGISNAVRLAMALAS